MEWEVYNLEKSEDSLYEFYSEGSKGKIRKAIKFQKVDSLGENVYNLAFGDVNEMTGELDDMRRSNNGDLLKIMHTVAEAVVDFIQARPEAIILIEGSSIARIRLYQMRIAGFWTEISKQFEVLGEICEKWQPFQKGVNYDRFLVYKKIE